METQTANLNRSGGSVTVAQARLHGTVWQQNAQTFATTPEQAIEAERRASISDAVATLSSDRRSREARRAKALHLVARSVERQNRIAGGGTIPLPICPACGSLCQHGGVL